jgi:hypothetical protein
MVRFSDDQYISGLREDTGIYSNMEMTFMSSQENSLEISMEIGDAHEITCSADSRARQFRS